MAALWMSILLGSCVSFKISPPPLPENFADPLVLCKKVTQKGELLFPEEIQEEFLSGSGSIYCYVRLHSVSRVISLKWKWYGPGGCLARETDDVIVNEDEAFLEAVTAYDKLETRIEDGDEGRWTVLVLVNGVLAGRGTFLLKR